MCTLPYHVPRVMFLNVLQSFKFNQFVWNGTMVWQNPTNVNKTAMSDSLANYPCILYMNLKKQSAIGLSSGRGIGQNSGIFLCSFSRRAWNHYLFIFVPSLLSKCWPRIWTIRIGCGIKPLCPQACSLFNKILANLIVTSTLLSLLPAVTIHHLACHIGFCLAGTAGWAAASQCQRSGIDPDLGYSHCAPLYDHVSSSRCSVLPTSERRAAL